jgi:hypothetical protein
MFELDSKYKVDTELPVIIDNYKILHFDEHPILFSGTNRYGNMLIGSLSYEDEETDLFRYFTVLIDNKEYIDFFNGKISYRDLLIHNKSIFIMDKNINEKVINTYYVPLETIPEDYLPHSTSFIPSQKRVQSTLNIAFSLKGKLADLHKAKVNDVNNINERIYNYLQESLETLNVLQLNPTIYSQPSQAASYRLNFDIEFNEERQISMFPINKGKVGDFIQEYLNYVSYFLCDENDGFLENNPEHSEVFSNLKQSFEQIFLSSNLATVSTISDILIENISSSAEKLSEVTDYLRHNNSFNSILVGKISESGEFLSIGYLNEDYKTAIESKIIQPEELEYNENVVADDSPNAYRILVYKINSETGKGSARLYPDSSEKYYKIKLYVQKGEKDIANSIFTKSLNENKVVDVEGIGTSVNGIFKKLDCYIK